MAARDSSTAMGSLSTAASPRRTNSEHDNIAELSSPETKAVLKRKAAGPGAEESVEAAPAGLASATGSADAGAFINSMVAQRDQLRVRFKRWSETVESTAKRLKYTTDNALVNQSMRLESILNAGKQKVDGAVGDQNSIRSQLTSFMSLLCSAQDQIFGSLGGSAASAAAEGRKPDAGR
ncbi:hypothetical protein GQ54DRAFT_298019 [Martensiomyces pterosporus]|nr:hypothetical protein GQ54DRAFT_298019 [Martensiomyces pterosporus]